MTKQLVWIMAAIVAVACGQEKQSPATPNVELTVYLVSGSAQGTTDDVPQDLGSTVKQLHSVFAYKSYKLSESFILRGRDQGSNALTEGIIPGSGFRYRFSYNRIWVSGDAPRAVHVDDLYLNLSRPLAITGDGKQGFENVASIHTGLDVREGQKTVVGKSSINSAGDALILVIVPKVID